MPLSAIAARKLAQERKQAVNATREYSIEVAATIAARLPDPPANDDEDNSSNQKITSRKRKRKQITTQEPEVITERSSRSKKTREHEFNQSHSNGGPSKTESTRVPIRNTVLSNGDEVASYRDPTNDNLPDSHQESSDHSDDNNGLQRSVPRYAAVRLSSVQTQSVTYKRIRNVSAAVVQLSPGNSLVANGQYDLYIRKGTVTLCGAVLHAGPRKYQVHAPSTHALPRIEAVQNPYGGGDNAAEVVLLSYDPGLRRLKTLQPGFVNIWNSPSSSRKRSFRILWSSAEDDTQRPLQALQEPGSWKALATNLINREAQRAPVVLVCGPKGTGKSTMNRFLTNAFLCSQKFSGLGFLDIDPGQPEFRPPGDLSLCELHEYNFGPPYSHPDCILGQNRVVKAHHFGSITPRNDPASYLECVLDLFRAHQAPHIPLLINCSGWILGSGLETLEALIRAIKPSDVVYMSTEGPEEVLDILQADVGQNGSLLHTLDSVPVQSAQRTSAELRSMQALSYFHATDIENNQLHWDSTPLAELPQQKWCYGGENKVIDAITLLHDEISPDYLEYLIEGSVLGIVAVDSDADLQQALDLDSDDQEAFATQDENTWNEQPQGSEHELETTADPDPQSRRPVALALRRTKEGLPYYFPSNGTYKPFDPSRSQALGQVLVQGIDEESKCLRVVTPVSLATVQQHRANGAVIVLVRGRLDRPSWAYLEPYYAGLWREQECERWKARYEKLPEQFKDSEDEELLPENDHMRFDVEYWVRKTPYVSIVRQEDSEHRRRQRSWKVRRNLETSEGRK